MNTLLSLMPGIRELRAPLIGGYLWLAAAWLVWGGQVIEHSRSNPAYIRLTELGQAAGPVGKALIVSISAYIIGSLVQTAIGASRVNLANLIAFFSYRRGRGTIHFSPEKTVVPGRGDSIQIDAIPPLIEAAEAERGGALRQRMEFGLWLLPRKLVDVWTYGRESALEDANRELRGSIRKALAKHGDSAIVAFDDDGGRWLVEVPDSDGEAVAIVLPKPPPIPVQMREAVLSSVSGEAWNRLSQLRSEAAFREALALPLFVLVLILTAQAGAGWLVALLLPLALLVQRSSLLRHAAWLSFGVFSSAIGTDDLDIVAPKLARYKAESKALAQAVEEARY